MKRFAAMAAFLFLSCAGTASAEGLRAAYEGLRSGKAVFEEECGGCHSLDVPLSLNLTREEWDAKIARMNAEGAQVDAGEKGLIIDFLTAKTAFEESCTVCHEKERCLSRNKSPEEWLRTVKRMSLRSDGGLTRQRIDTISSYLAVVCPAK